MSKIIARSKEIIFGDMDTLNAIAATPVPDEPADAVMQIKKTSIINPKTGEIKLDRASSPRATMETVRKKLLAFRQSSVEMRKICPQDSYYPTIWGKIKFSP